MVVESLWEVPFLLGLVSLAFSFLFFLAFSPLSTLLYFFPFPFLSIPFLLFYWSSSLLRPEDASRALASEHVISMGRKFLGSTGSEGSGFLGMRYCGGFFFGILEPLWQKRSQIVGGSIEVAKVALR
jgi:hypothetical protein